MIQRIAMLTLTFAAWAALAATPTLNNDDSCDISPLPAATLLLPYFEVDIEIETGENTLFTVTNVTQLPRIARVTLWTDRAYPVYSFDIFLAGYDVQSISLLDVLRFGSIARPSGTTSNVPPGQRSLDVNPQLDVSNCAGNERMRRIPGTIAMDVQDALTIGRAAACGTKQVGGKHAGKAIGYATIDVVKSCSGHLPSDPSYFTSEILFDNVLIGDYQQINVSENYAQGGTMVHIRAIPEGGAAGSVQPSFAHTFYSRLQSGGTIDRRQPLPSTFAARWITGSTESFVTSFKIWREGDGGASDSCSAAANQWLGVPELVRFDEDENPVSYNDVCVIMCPPRHGVDYPSASRIAASNTFEFPPNPGGDVAGWMYMNLGGRQNWVITSMAAEGRFSIDVDATALGNGCTPIAEYTSEEGGEPAIGPAPNTNPKPALLAATTNNDDSCDIAQLPAATLLLPYFEVDTRTRAGEETIFTITNVSQRPQIARITIWTDRSYPVLTFNVFLTGYDIQSISLFDVIAAGRIAPPNGTSSNSDAGMRSLDNDENSLLDISKCNQLPSAIPAPLLAEFRAVLTTGLVGKCGTTRVGSLQPDGVSRGYVTIDVVDSCGTTNPNDAGYITSELLYDNVLTGDYQQINRRENFAQSGALVHIRAIPEDGVTTNLERTFYGRYQAQGVGADRRQPLPSTFAARWISGGPGSFDTSFKIWREGLSGANAGCVAVSSNWGIPTTEFVRFDDEENPTTNYWDCSFTCPPNLPLPSSSRVTVANTSIFPPNPGGDDAGWMYMNLNHGGTPAGASDPLIASQNWVVISMEAAGRYSVDFDAIALGNGCSPVAPVTAEDESAPAIAPAPNTNPVF